MIVFLKTIPVLSEYRMINNPQRPLLAALINEGNVQRFQCDEQRIFLLILGWHFDRF